MTVQGIAPHRCADCGADVIYRIEREPRRAVPDRCSNVDCPRADAASATGDWYYRGVPGPDR